MNVFWLFSKFTSDLEQSQGNKHLFSLEAFHQQVSSTNLEEYSEMKSKTQYLFCSNITVVMLFLKTSSLFREATNIIHFCLKGRF